MLIPKYLIRNQLIVSVLRVWSLWRRSLVTVDCEPPLDWQSLHQSQVITMFALLHLTLLSPVLSSLQISVSRSSDPSSFLSPASGRLAVKEGRSRPLSCSAQLRPITGTPFYVRCVSGDHFSTNSSIIWDVKTKVDSMTVWWESETYLYASNVYCQSQSCHQNNLLSKKYKHFCLRLCLCH